MIDRPGSTRQRLGVAAALGFVLSLAGPSMSHAAPSKASGTGYVNELPCNDICKAYMAWSDRMMAKFRSASQSRPKTRTAVHRKPDRTAARASQTRHSDLNSFARLLRPSDTPAQVVETPQVAAPTPSGPVEAIAERLSPAAGTANTRLADAGSAATTTEPQTTLVSLTAPISGTEDMSATDNYARGRDWLLTASLGLAVIALFALLSWERFKRTT